MRLALAGSLLVVAAAACFLAALLGVSAWLWVAGAVAAAGGLAALALVFVSRPVDGEHPRHRWISERHGGA